MRRCSCRDSLMPRLDRLHDRGNRLVKGGLLGALVTAIGCGLLPTSVNAADIVGLVKSLSGTARLHRGAQDLAVAQSMAVVLKDEIITAQAARDTVDLKKSAVLE